MDRDNGWPLGRASGLSYESGSWTVTCQEFGYYLNTLSRKCLNRFRRRRTPLSRDTMRSTTAPWRNGRRSGLKIRFP